MNRSILLILGACLFICASCASSQPERALSAPAAMAQPSDQQADKPAQPAKLEAATSAEDPTEDEARNDGPIDLGLDDGSGEPDAPIVINRPNTAADAAALNVASETTEFDKKCEAPADCQGLEAPECAGEMQCVEQQCVYACAAEDSEGFAEPDEFAEPMDDALEADGFENANSETPDEAAPVDE
jgi:hypothetical protein